MKFNSKIDFPQKSILGFKVLSSLQSSLSCYLLLLIGKFLNPLFGSNQIQIINFRIHFLFVIISITIYSFLLFIDFIMVNFINNNLDL